MNDLEKTIWKAKIRWWEYIPVLGTIIYVIRYELFLINDSSKYVKKNVLKFKSGFASFFSLSTLAFMIAHFTFLFQDNMKIWLFWTGLSLAIFNSLSSIFLKVLYTKGIKRYMEKYQIEDNNNVFLKIKSYKRGKRFLFWK